MSFRGLFDLTGKHVLATGAGGGIGTTVCRGFSEFGAEVACLDISEEIREPNRQRSGEGRRQGHSGGVRRS